MSMVLVDKEKLRRVLRDCVETGYIRGHCDTVKNAFNLQYDMVSYEIVEALERENGPVSSLNPIPADGLIEALTLAINRFETIADGIDNGDCDSIAPTLLRRAANTADKALKGEK